MQVKRQVARLVSHKANQQALSRIEEDKRNEQNNTFSFSSAQRQALNDAGQQSDASQDLNR